MNSDTTNKPLLTLEAAFIAILNNSNLKEAYTVQDMLDFAAEDKYGGRDTGHFPIAVSVYRAEGQLLYAMVRALKPKFCAEFGSADGGSATHILAALEKNGGGGWLWSVDLNPDIGGLIPKSLKSRWRQLVGDATDPAIHAIIGQADLVFEDTDHTYAVTRQVLQQSLRLHPKFVASHDYILSSQVGEAFNDTFGEDRVEVAVLGTEFTVTGMGIWTVQDMGMVKS